VFFSSIFSVETTKENRFSKTVLRWLIPPLVGF